MKWISTFLAWSGLNSPSIKAVKDSVQVRHSMVVFQVLLNFLSDANTSAVNVRLDRSQRAVDDLTDFLVAKLMNSGENKNFLMFVGQLVNHLFDNLFELTR